MNSVVTSLFPLGGRRYSNHLDLYAHPRLTHSHSSPSCHSIGVRLKLLPELDCPSPVVVGEFRPSVYHSATEPSS